MSACAMRAGRHGPKLFTDLIFSACQRKLSPCSVNCLTKWFVLVLDLLMSILVNTPNSCIDSLSPEHDSKYTLII